MFGYDYVESKDCQPYFFEFETYSIRTDHISCRLTSSMEDTHGQLRLGNRREPFYQKFLIEVYFCTYHCVLFRI